VPGPDVMVNPINGRYLGLEDGDMVVLSFGEQALSVVARFDESVPEGVALLPRHLQMQGAPLSATLATISKPEGEPI
jgi:hypothetical protein